MHKGTITVKTFRIFIRVYPLLRSEQLSANIKLTLHKVFIRPITTYARSSWEFAAGTCLLKSYRL